ncbi:Concanavalin A-like lectin/glucanase, subgroup [Cynara cardunculus var. scolymus]|uniref:non-specific serine/threonine protein kinase n=1 Tax=Cynara cardunculus var. scolymus TaxID=59895 RepID=A0A103Y6C7_CYNCS|nr:Concanavalin A-like lectin/glucanase, subgroup [Cynara cardunculus var. scolymus]
MGIGCFGAFDSCKARSGKTPDEIATNNVKQFSYNSLRSATRNFHPSNKIGGGGFGVVYKGILRDDTHVAVKSLSAESKQGTIEFLTEINLISSIQHPNLVQLIGCCIEDGNRILVYEYLENNSLASALLGSRGKHIDLDWATRASICEGTAAGLAFLHEEAEPHIVHRDIKASNVLLDGSFHPKIGDFGLAKLFPDNVTHLSTRVAGTVGYLAPEYALLGQLTKKADVYSFGSWKLKDEERLLDVVDPDLTNCPDDEIMRFITVALFCTQAASNQRPSMKQVVEMLTRKVHLNAKLLTEPGIFKARSSCRQSDDGVSVGTTKSRAVNGKQSLNPFVTSLPQVQERKRDSDTLFAKCPSERIMGDHQDLVGPMIATTFSEKDRALTK